jgi:hypothetical protein
MIRFIMLLSGAMLLTINTLSAQMTVQHLEPKPKKKNEIGLTIDEYNGASLTLRRERKVNQYWRLDGNITSQGSYYNRFGLSFGIENRIPITGKLSVYHGLNINTSSATLTGFFSDQVLLSRSLSVGYRLGARIDINKRFFIGAEINPQIGVTHQNGTYENLGNSSSFIHNMPNNQFFKSLGQGTVTMGVKF